jgi:hypothetical protein
VLPAVSIFVTATFKGGTKSLPSEIHVGPVIAGVADASIEMLLPFGRSGRQLFWSGGAAVMGVDAIGGRHTATSPMRAALSELPCGTQWG